MAATVKWAVGLTTCPKRRYTLLPATLESLQRGGFDLSSVRMFVDGTYDHRGWQEQYNQPLTVRYPTVGPYVSWILGLAELYARNPNATHYAMFQDDLKCVSNLREYLERVPVPARTYYNLFTFMENEVLNGKAPGWYPGSYMPKASRGQRGRGALGLVFNRDGVIALLSSQAMIERVQEPKRGWRFIDGAVVHALNKAGYTEYVHNPSLLYHTGEVPAMEGPGRPAHFRWVQNASTFPGESHDALSFLPSVP